MAAMVNMVDWAFALTRLTSDERIKIIKTSPEKKEVIEVDGMKKKGNDEDTLGEAELFKKKSKRFHWLVVCKPRLTSNEEWKSMR